MTDIIYEIEQCVIKLNRAKENLMNLEKQINLCDKKWVSYKILDIKNVQKKFDYFCNLEVALLNLKQNGFPNLLNISLDVHGLTKKQFDIVLDYIFFEIYVNEYNNIYMTIITGKGKNILRNFLIKNFEDFNQYYELSLKLNILENGNFLVNSGKKNK